MFALKQLYLYDATPGLDLSPLAGHRGLQIWLSRGQDVKGVGGLGRGVRIRRWPQFAQDATDV